jgi:hypothetical protein
MVPHRHAKRAWSRHKTIPVKWFNLVGKCSNEMPFEGGEKSQYQGPLV